MSTFTLKCLLIFRYVPLNEFIANDSMVEITFSMFMHMIFNELEKNMILKSFLVN